MNYFDAGGPRFAGSFAPAVAPTQASATNGSPAAIEPAGERAEFLVASFNVKFGEEPHNALDTLRDGGLEHADALLLQEMTLAATVQIAAALRMNYVYYPANVHPDSGRPFGVAILSPWPIRDDYKIVLPDFIRARDPAAKAAAAAIIWIEGIPVGVVNVHLQLGLSPEQTRSQANALVECIFSAACRNPVTPTPAPEYLVLGGDLNTSTDGKMAAADDVLAAAGLRRVPGIGRTYKYLFLGLGKLDHIYASRALAVEDSGQVRGFFATGSDHFPVWARLRLTGEPPEPWLGFDGDGRHHGDPPAAICCATLARPARGRRR